MKLDIVSVCKPERRKVACVCAYQYADSDDIGLDITVEKFSFVLGSYSSRRCAIRGARRFCALIGFECEVVK
jgi:hypothetical protein